MNDQSWPSGASTQKQKSEDDSALLSAPTLISSTIARLGAAISSDATSLPGEEELLSLPHQELQGQLKELRVSEEHQGTFEVAPNVLARPVSPSPFRKLQIAESEYGLQNFTESGYGFRIYGIEVDMYRISRGIIFGSIDSVQSRHVASLT